MAGVVVFVGDGLSAGARWDERFPEFEVHNLGVSGDTTDEVIARLDSVAETDPDAVVLQVGTNDVGWQRSDEYIVRNIETILWTLHKKLPVTRLLVQSVPPREQEFVPLIRTINCHVRQFAPTVKAHYLDLWPALADSEGKLSAEWSTDSLHLTEAGYVVWLSELRPALVDLLESPQTLPISTQPA
ncbi:GDSL-type esterase/lipase family protein [Cryobacterium sp. SO2]|uniref:GDSL-type esterase/lipase family protein n=1 Tax=Cryobacterium sp. SO2 TaxID=1897060 RepID=UPI00223DC5D8|nr:GDSL-type esterase/lipase family protein [Cryobacterium sp. SO2]WEO78547.1 GDSL-type esterase/lipase family protein [Cryobacterium sp. SO2]